MTANSKIENPTRFAWYDFKPEQVVKIGKQKYLVLGADSSSVAFKTLTGRNAGDENTVTIQTALYWFNGPNPTGTVEKDG